jgi:hypothetical protein
LLALLVRAALHPSALSAHITRTKMSDRPPVEMPMFASGHLFLHASISVLL